LSNGPDDEYFADGLTEEILNSLAHLPELLVTARTSSFSFKGQNVPIPQVAEKLGVAHVVEGSVRRDGNRLRITAQLNRAADGFHLWSDTYDRSSEDNFAVQADIAEKVAAALNVMLREEQLTRMRSTGLRNPEAFVAFQKGRELLDHAHALPRSETPNVLLQANKYFERTIELAPEFSLAHALHADYYLHLVSNAPSLDKFPKEKIEEALRHAQTDYDNAARFTATEAERLNRNLDAALLAGQWRRLANLVSAALRLPECMGEVGWWVESEILDSPSEALIFWQKEVECDPLSPYAWYNFAIAQIELGDFDAAIRTAKRGLQFVTHWQIAEQLIVAYIASAQFYKAEAALDRYFSDEKLRLIYRLRMSAAQGDVARTDELLDELIERFGANSPSITDYAISGHRDRANQLAATLDSRPLAIYSLLNSIDHCFCGIPFDLEYAPNYARMIEEAGISWPPPAPINWPLKDW
jgi:TolB-like protein